MTSTRSWAVWFFITASVCAGQTARPGGATTTQRPRAGGPEFVVSVTQFGAVADDRTDCAEAFQRAVDYIAAKIDREIPKANGQRARGVVLIPAAARAYRVGRPIWVDMPYVEIQGEGQGTRVECFPQRNHPLFLFGLRRVADVTVDGKTQRLEPSARYRPDLYGKLDASAAPSRGMRGGFRTRGETLIQAQATPLSDGPRHSRGDFTTDHWYETRALTVELAVEGRDGDKMEQGVHLLGIGVVTKDLAYPIHVYTDAPNQYVVRFSTQAKRFGPQKPRRFTFSSGDARGLQRLAFQIDLERAEVSAYVNGRETAVREPILGDDWKPGLRFAENDYFPLLIGDAGGDRPALGTNSRKDWTLAGLLFSRAARYLKQGEGKPQRRRERPEEGIDDLYRYFTPQERDPDVIGFFPFTDRPNENSRMLTIQGGSASGGHKTAAFLLHSLQNLPGGIHDNGIRDLHLVGANLYGQNLAIGQVLDLRISGVRSTGAYHAIGSLSNGAHYTVRMEDCTLDGTDSGYFALDQILWARNIHFAGAGRSTMRFVSSVVNMENMFVGFHTPNNESTIKIHAGDYGGNYSFKNLLVDYEGPTYLHTAVMAEIHPYAPETSLRLTDINLGTVGEEIPIITLKEGHPSWRKTGYLSVDVLQTFTAKSGPLVDVDGPGWRGSLKGIMVGESQGIRYSGPVGTSTRLKLSD